MRPEEVMHFVFDKLTTIQTAVDQQFRGELALQNRFKRVVPKFLMGDDKIDLMKMTMASAINVLNNSTWTVKDVQVDHLDIGVDGACNVTYVIETDNVQFDAVSAMGLTRSDSGASSDNDEEHAIIDFRQEISDCSSLDECDKELSEPAGGFTASCYYVVKKEFAMYGK
jgi:hypothetical protein